MSDLGPAPIADDLDPQSVKPDPGAPKPRLAPKLGIRGQIAFAISLRQRARMVDGKDADCAWLLLTPIDLERLEDLADGLDKILLDAEIKKRTGSRGTSR